MLNTLYTGDNLFILNGLNSDLVDLIYFIIGVGKIHSKAMMSYLTYMAQRIVEMHRILKDTGSIYLHCDPTASHYLKILLDEIFGKNNFRNEIIWYYKNASRGKKQLAKAHDVILCYSKTSFCINQRSSLQWAG